MEPTFTFSQSGGFSEKFGALLVLGAIWGLVVTVFWMVVGWRAMRAHERLANATEDLARKGA